MFKEVDKKSVGNKEDVAEYIEYTKEDLLPDGGKLFVRTIRPYYLVLMINDHIETVTQVPPVEYKVFMSLMQNHPWYAPREEILAACTGRTIEQSRKAVRSAEREGAVINATRPAINAIGRLRTRLVPFYIAPCAWLKYGYIISSTIKESELPPDR